AAPRPIATDPALLERVAALEAATRALPAAIAQLRQQVDAATGAARDAKARADAATDKADNAAAPRPGAVERGDLDALATRLGALERAERSIEGRLGQAATGAAADRAVRLAVTAAALRESVERGAAFAPLLAAVKMLGADTTKL